MISRFIDVKSLFIAETHIRTLIWKRNWYMCLGELSFSVTEGKNLPGKPIGHQAKKRQEDRVAVLQVTERTS